MGDMSDEASRRDVLEKNGMNPLRLVTAGQVHGVNVRVVDPGDAVRRRKCANQIYRDLVALRISTERAAMELQKLNKRQKGGWLVQKLLSARNFVARNLSGFLIRGTK